MEWVQVAQTFGLPVALLLILLAALWRILRWLAENVVLPLVRKHLEFLDKAMGAMDRVAANVEAQTATSAKIAGALSTIQTRLDRHDAGAPPAG